MAWTATISSTAIPDARVFLLRLREGKGAHQAEWARYVYDLHLGTRQKNLDFYINADVDQTADATGAAGEVVALWLDNSANSASTYFKLYDAAAPTVGTTAPDNIFEVGASERIGIIFSTPLTFSTDIAIAGVTTAGTAGVTGPTSLAKAILALET